MRKKKTYAMKRGGGVKPRMMKKGGNVKPRMMSKGGAARKTMTIAQLRAEAKKKGLKLVKDTKKA